MVASIHGMYYTVMNLTHHDEKSKKFGVNRIDCQFETCIHKYMQHRGHMLERKPSPRFGARARRLSPEASRPPPRGAGADENFQKNDYEFSSKNYGKFRTIIKNDENVVQALERRPSPRFGARARRLSPGAPRSPPRGAGAPVGGQQRRSTGKKLVVTVL